jgi:glutamate-ammonia-ligase adenylyltransferase
MRERIFREHGSADPWNLKHARGGLVEQEFCAQYLQLAHAHAHPELRRPGTAAVVAAAGRLGILEPAQARALGAALELHHALLAVLRLSLDDRFNPATAPEGLRTALARAAREDPSLPVSAADFAGVERRLVESQATVRQIFDRLCPPAAG